MQPVPKHPTELVARPVEALFEEREEQLDLRRYWRTITKYKWGILALGLLGGIGASIYALSLEPVYRATATLLIEAKPTKYVSIQDVYESYYQTAQYYETQYQILQSRALAESVVDRSELWKHPALDPSQAPESRAPLQIGWRNWLSLRASVR